MDISLNGGIKINGEKLRVNYRWNFDEFFESQYKNYPYNKETRQPYIYFG